MNYVVTTEIRAPQARVFLWLDGGERVKRWLPNLVENIDLQVMPEKVGSRFRHVYVENGRRMEMAGTVTAYEVDRRLACTLHGDVFDLIVDYRLDGVGGRTRLTQRSEIHFHSASMRVVMAIVQPILRIVAQRRARRTFSELAKLAESMDEGGR